MDSSGLFDAIYPLVVDKMVEKGIYPKNIETVRSKTNGIIEVINTTIDESI